MAIFRLFKYNQSNKIDVRIGDGTVKITIILTVRAMLTFKKKTVGGQVINRGAKIKIGGAMPTYVPTLAMSLAESVTLPMSPYRF